MKIQYKSVTETIVIDVDDDWGKKVLELNLADYNSERSGRRPDHKYCPGQPITVDEMESETYCLQRKRSRGLVRANEILNGLIRDENNARVRRAVDMLPVDQRDLITALFFQDVKAVDYGKSRKVSKAAVSQQLNRALKNLKKYLS